MVPRRARAPARRRGGSASAAGRPSAIQAAARVATNTASDPLTGQPSSSCSRTVDLGHVAGGEDAEGADGQVDRLAGVVDGDALAPHHPERLVHRAERVGAQRHRAQDLAGPDVDLDPAARRRRRGAARRGRVPAPGTATSASTDARRRAAGAGRASACQRREHLGPAGAAQVGRHGGPATSTSSTSHPGRQRRAPAPSAAAEVGRARRAADPHDAGAVGAQRDGQAAGAWGPRRTTSSRRHSTRTASPVLVGQGPGPGGHRAVPLPAEGAAVGQRRGRLVAGAAPAGVGLDVGGLDPGRLQREGPVARRAASTGCDRGTVLLRPCDASAPGPGGAEAGGERRRRRPAGPARRAARCRRRSRRRRGRRRGPRSGRPAPRPGPARRPAAGCAGSPGRRAGAPSTPSALQRGLDDRLPARAAAQVGAQRRLDVAGASAAAPAPAASSAASRMTMPGVQKPHWLAPCCDEGGGPAVAQRPPALPRAW